MIRERRSMDKLKQYHQKYVHEGVIDPNVHPWVAQSWQQSRANKVPYDQAPQFACLSKPELKLLQKQHEGAISYLEGMYREIREFFNIYNLNLLLMDATCRVLKSYSLPFYQRSAGLVEGARLDVATVGATSAGIVKERKAPFLLFGPETWLKEWQEGDACSAPVMVNGEIAYILTLAATAQLELPHHALVAQALTLKQALEAHLNTLLRLKAEEAILDAAPFAVYHIMPGGEVAYTNKLGRSRLAGIRSETADDERINLNDVVLNYRHTPIYKGFNGIPSFNKEVTWITPSKTYEDITTVVPLGRDSDREVSSVVAVSMPIEDLRTLVAHAVGFTARYSLNSMVGEGQSFVAMKEKAARIARNQNHILLQGESGAGKQRMAHGIHQGSSRAAGPLISVKCGDLTPELLEQELFGVAEIPDVSRPGKLELANGGALFIDELEKLPRSVAALLAKALREKKMRRVGESVERPIDVRIIGASDSDLRRLTERGSFLQELYDMIAKSVIRVPPLRTRREDIPMLAGHIIDELAAQHQIPGKKLLPETEELLKTYDWPGNIKQLQGVIEQAFFNTDGGVIKPGDINLIGDVKPDNVWKEDKDVFVKVWQAAGGNISRMANLLDVSRVTLYRYLKKYGLEKS